MGSHKIKNLLHSKGNNQRSAETNYRIWKTDKYLECIKNSKNILNKRPNKNWATETNYLHSFPT